MYLTEDQQNDVIDSMNRMIKLSNLCNYFYKIGYLKEFNWRFDEYIAKGLYKEYQEILSEEVERFNSRYSVSGEGRWIPIELQEHYLSNVLYQLD